MAQRVFTPTPHPMGALASAALLSLRVGAGGLLLAGHGWPKLQRYSELTTSFADPIGLGPMVSFILVLVAEVLCASMIVVGLGTRLASVPILIFLAVAAFVQHGADPWPKKELPILYIVPFLAILIAGGGRYSLDAAVTRVIGKWPKT